MIEEAYFDNAASTKPYNETAEYMKEFMLSCYANPSSAHKKGFEAHKIIEYTNTQILTAFNLDKRRIVYTSGATESANLAIKGTLEKITDLSKCSIITSAIEHPCVSEVFKYYEKKSVDVRYIDVDPYGKINEKSLYESITSNTKLVSIIWVNNELGIVQNITRIMRRIKQINPLTLIHIDAVQGFTKVIADLSLADMISISAHKIHGPKGIGALILKKNITLEPQNLGGGQQNNFRSGTIPAPLIAGFGKSCEIHNQKSLIKNMREVQNYLYTELSNEFGSSIFNTKLDENEYAPHILNLSFLGLKGEVIVHMLEERGIYISMSSACSSHNKTKKTSLTALGLNQQRIDGTIRISISEFTTIEECKHLIKELSYTLERLKNLYKGNLR